MYNRVQWHRSRSISHNKLKVIIFTSLKTEDIKLARFKELVVHTVVFSETYKFGFEEKPATLF